MEVVMIFGKVCSGKSTYMCEHYKGALTIDVGSIVRELTKSIGRTHNALLANDIIKVLNEKLMNASVTGIETVVIAGVRQVRILEAVRDFIISKVRVKFKIIHLDVPEFVLRKRFFQRANAKDSELTFDQVIHRDNELGYSAIIAAIKVFPYKCYLKTVLNFQSHEIDSLQESKE